MALLLAASAYPLWAAAHVSRHLGDDAFITLTFARSLAAGEGFRFHGQVVLGTTSPLLALLVAGLARLAPAIALEDVAIWLTAAAWLVTAWTLVVARRSFGVGLWPATFLALLTLLGGWAHSLGMEAYLFAALLVIAIGLALARRPLAAGVATGLLALARGEGLLLAPLLLLADGARTWSEHCRSAPRAARDATDVRDRADVRDPSDVRDPTAVPTWSAAADGWFRRGLRFGAGWLAVVAVWCAYAVPVFGSPLPATLAAKLAQSDSGLWAPFARDLTGRWLPAWAAAWGSVQLPVLNPIWWLVAAGVWFAAARRRRWLVLLAWGCLYVAGYGLLGVPGYPWYSLPVIFVLQLLAGLGVVALAERVRDRPGPSWRRALVVVVAAYVLAAAVVPRVSAIRSDAGDPRAASYLGLVAWLRDHAPPTARVAYVEVGYLGYFGRNPVLDLAGLVTPEVVTDVRRGDSGAAFWRHRPDYLVYLPDFDWFLHDVVADPRLAREYRAVASLPGPYGTPLTVYRRIEPETGR